MTNCVIYGQDLESNVIEIERLNKRIEILEGQKENLNKQSDLLGQDFEVKKKDIDSRFLENKIEIDKDLSGVRNLLYTLGIGVLGLLLGYWVYFRSFIKNELFNKINNEYRTSDKRAIIGESAAGIFVIETFLLDNNMFDYYIAMDPALWYNEQYLVKNFDSLVKEDYEQKKKLWFAGSDAVDISPHTRELNKKLENFQLIKTTFEKSP